MRDFTVVTQEGAVSLLPNHPHQITPVAKNQARGLDEMPHTWRFHSVQTFMSGMKETHTHLNLGVTK